MVHDYTACSSVLIDVLGELKNALLTFDNARLNRILDEKAVLNSEILMINDALETHIKSRYDEFSTQAAEKMLNDFPEVTSYWGALQVNMKIIKQNLTEIKRVVTAIEKYYASLSIPSDMSNKKKYSNYYTRN